MKDNKHFVEEYELGRIIRIAAFAVLGCFFPVALMLFLSSRTTSHHPPFNSDTIGEMLGYAEYFIFVVVAYFGTAVLIWRTGGFWSQFVPAWFPISVVGSFVLCFTFFTRVWIGAAFDSSIDTNSDSGSFFGVLAMAFIVSVVFSICAGVFSSIANVLLPSREPENS